MYIYNLGQRFEYIVRKNKKKTAIIYENKGEQSFESLEIQSNQIANYLINQGLRAKDVVAIQNGKKSVSFATMIACLKLGIIYTNFDFTNPKERIKKIFLTACPKMVIADSMNEIVRELCDLMQIEYVNMENNDILQKITSNSEVLAKETINSVSDCNPAYIMFTSGSTGIPKGVLISQRSLLNFIDWGKETFCLNDNDILTNVNPIYFDNSVFDFYCSIFNGITMVAIPKYITEKPKEMLKIIDETKCTFWFSVPSMLIYLTNLKLLGRNTLQNIRAFSFGGEGYPKELLRKLYEIYSESADFYNVYGPTEGTCICSAYQITKEDMEQDGLVSLGQIASNFDYLILDEEGNEKTVGELYLLGNQLALGYYNDEERTSKSFIKYDKNHNYDVRMYKTGDLVKVIDGRLFFVGRADNQIKHMGYRIELEEIENALIKIDGITQCAVVHTVSKNNFSKIIGFIATEKSMDLEYVRKEVKKYLPSYMIPNSFEFLREIPKNSNGKIDKMALLKRVK